MTDNFHVGQFPFNYNISFRTKRHYGL